jgi:3-deoxy-7-phosphoheptulonate synthase
MNGKSDLSDALAYCREMLVGIVNMGMPIGLELLDQVGLPHLADLVTFGWLGARDCLGNVSPSLLSGFSGIGGIKNPLNGDIKGAVDAMVKASLPQDFFGISQELGTCARLQTLGNGDVVLILRGTDKGPNYYQYSVEQAIEVLDSRGFTDIGVVIDVSHGNSGKDASKQFSIVKEVLAWRPVSRVGHRVVGVMVEAYLLQGKQPVPQDRNGFHVSQVTPGQSVVDDCIGIKEFKELYEYVCRSIPH